MSASLDISMTKATLTKVGDWDAWEDLFIRRAQSLGVWRYVDPERDDEIQKPDEVDFVKEFRQARARYQKRGDGSHCRDEDQCSEAAASNDGQGSEAATSEVPTELESQWIMHSIKQLDEERRGAHRHELDARAKLTRWVYGTVDPAYMRAMPRELGLRQTYAELRQRFCVSRVTRLEVAQRAYADALVMTRDEKPEGWFNDWEKAYLEGRRLGIPDVDGPLSIIRFLEAAAAVDAEWARAKLRDYRAQQLEATDDDGVKMTLLGLGRLLLHTWQDNARCGPLASPAAAAMTTLDHDGGIGPSHAGESVCGLIVRRPTEKPTDCSVWATAVSGAHVRKVSEHRTSAARPWNNVEERGGVDTIKTHARLSARVVGAVNDALWPKSSAYAVLDLSARDAQAAVGTMAHSPRLRDLTLLDNCASGHVVNSHELLVRDVVTAGADDVVLVGDTAVKVTSRGTRVLKGLLDGPDGPKTRDLVLRDVAFVPGFHTNLIAGERLKQEGYWFCGLDDTLRYGSLERNQVLLQLVVAEAAPT